MITRIFIILFLSSFLLSCARVESSKTQTAVSNEIVPPLESIDIANYYGQKQRVMVFPWNISKVDLEKFPLLRDNRIGFGVSNRLTDILFDVNRFEFIEEKQEIANRLIQQMQLCKTPDVCQEGGIKSLQLKTADYIIYPEVYHFGIEKQMDISGIDTSNRQYVEIGIQIKIVNAHTAETLAIGSYIGQKVLTSQGDIFNNPQINFSQSALGKATDAAIKGAIYKVLKRFDAIAVANPPTPTIAAKSSAPITAEIEQRGTDGHKKTMSVVQNSSTVAIPSNYPQKRLALVIGNADYQLPDVSLANASHDAEDMSHLLAQLGFDVSLYLNQTKPSMQQDIQSFAQKLKTAGPGTVALFYYAGHASEIEGINYMFPIEVQLKGEAMADQEGVAVQEVLDQMGNSGGDLNILMLDACRDNPYPPQKRAFNSKYNRLATMNGSKGMIISYATASGKQASDGMGRNGLYTGELLKFIPTPNLKIEDVLKRVRNAVSEKSGNDQIAWENSSLVSDFYFIPPK